MLGFGRTDLGSVRQNNEDAIFVSNENIGALENLYIISDGMGGHNAGEVASSKAIEFFIEKIQEHSGELAEGDIIRVMSEAVRHANKSVHGIASQHSEMSGMGTTFTAITFRGAKGYVVHIGDSRAYVIKPPEMQQITTDHTYVNDLVRAEIISDEQARTHHLRNVITRALGSEADCEVDAYIVDVEQGDKFLLCSDGLTTMLEDSEIEMVVATSPDFEQVTAKLVSLANEQGGVDNISVILIGEGGAGDVA